MLKSCPTKTALLPASPKSISPTGPLRSGAIRTAQCGPTSDPAEFIRDLGALTEDPLEVRLMADEPSADEEVMVTALELLVQ